MRSKRQLSVIQLFVFVCLMGSSCENDENPILNQNQINSSVSEQITVPTTTIHSYSPDPTYHFLGNGYDVTGFYADERSLRGSVIDVNQLQSVQPQFLDRLDLNSGVNRWWTSVDAEDHALQLSRRAGLGDTPLFGGTINLMITGEQAFSNRADGRKLLGTRSEIRSSHQVSFNIIDANNLQGFLTPEFRNDVQSLSPEQIVLKYGTHLLSNYEVGYRLDLHYSAETREQDREQAITSFLSLDPLTTNSEIVTEEQVRYEYYGGNSPTGGITTVDLTTEGDKSIEVEPWLQTFTQNNLTIADFSSGNQSLIPIYELISDSQKRVELEIYLDSYLSDNSVQLDHIPDPVNVYYDSKVENHFLTIDSSDLTPNFELQGNWFNAFSYSVDGSVPLYRYYLSNGKKSNHKYTTKPRAFVEGYQFEGVAFYVFDEQLDGTVPIYSHYSVHGLNHLYSTSSESIAGYKLDGVAFYAFPAD